MLKKIFAPQASGLKYKNAGTLWAIYSRTFQSHRGASHPGQEFTVWRWHDVLDIGEGQWQEQAFWPKETH